MHAFKWLNPLEQKANKFVFCSGGTEANNQVLWTLVNQKDKHIIILRSDRGDDENLYRFNHTFF